MKHPVGMWVRYDDGSIEYSTYAVPKEPVARKVAGFISKIREYVGSCFSGKPSGYEEPSPDPEGSLFDAVLRRHTDGRRG